MDPTIIGATIAFVAALLGAAIVAISNFYISKWRESADREREDRKNAIEVKRAARMIEAELRRAAAGGTICVERMHWWSADVRPLSTDAWQKYGATLAPDLSNSAWDALNVAIEAVENIRMFHGLAVGNGQLNITQSTVAQIVPMLNDIKNGRDALCHWMDAGREIRPSLIGRH